VRARVIGEEEKASFNNFISNHAKGHILQTWEWGELKERSLWQPLRLIVEDQGTIYAAISLLKRQLPAGMGCLFYAPRGPVLDINDSLAWDTLWQGCRDLAAEHKAVFCKIDPDVADDDKVWNQRIKAAGFVAADKGEGFEGVQPRYVFRLDISPDEETLMANFHQKTRYNLRLAERKEVTVTAAAPQSELPVFYQLLQETAQRDNFLIRPFSYYKDFYDLLIPQGLAEMFLVYYQGKAIAGSLAFILGNKAWYIYGASANQYRNVMPNYLMQWRMIQWAKQHGCTMYDFRGVPGDVAEDHPLYGLVKFKKGFGGNYIRFIGEYDLVYKPFVYKMYNDLEPLYQKGVRKLIHAKKRLLNRG